MKDRPGSTRTEVSRLGPGGVRELIRAAPLFDHRLSRTAARAYLRDRRNVFFLARLSGEPVGFLRGTSLMQLHTGRRQMFLYEIGVAPSHRDQGVGRSLVEALLRYCRELDFQEVFVFTDPGNTAAVNLYQSTGARTETPADRMFVYPLRPTRTLRTRRPVR